MKLSDAVSHAGLALYAELALVIFAAVFVAVVFDIARKTRREELERQASLPLQDDGGMS